MNLPPPLSCRQPLLARAVAPDRYEVADPVLMTTRSLAREDGRLLSGDEIGGRWVLRDPDGGIAAIDPSRLAIFHDWGIRVFADPIAIPPSPHHPDIAPG